MFQTPTGAHMPQLHQLLADIPATLHQVAQHLDLHPATLARYKAIDQAPRPVMLALFWQSRWGQSLAHTTAHNSAVLYAQQADILRRQNARLHDAIRALEADRLHGINMPANLPFFRLG